MCAHSVGNNDQILHGDQTRYNIIYKIHTRCEENRYVQPRMLFHDLFAVAKRRCQVNAVW